MGLGTNGGNQHGGPLAQPPGAEADLDGISSASIRKNWARIGSVKFTTALSGTLSSDGSEKLPEAPKHRSIRDTIDPDIYVDYMDLRMKNKLGEGAFARVFQATYLEDGREVAVKMLRHEHLTHMSEVFLFLKEFKTVKHMRHENIVQLIGIGGVQDATGKVVELFIVQEMCRGGTLRTLVQDQMITVNRELYSLRMALEWSLQIAEALWYLHRRKPPVVHRDLKLENVILSVPLRTKFSLRFSNKTAGDENSVPGTMIERKRGGSLPELLLSCDRSIDPSSPTPKSLHSYAPITHFAAAKLADFGLATFLDHGQKTKRLLQGAQTSKDPAQPLGRNASKVVRLLERMRTFSSFGGSEETEGIDEESLSIGRVDSLIKSDNGNDVTGVAGSYGYMAPEVFKDQPYNEKVDVFSFGVMMYNLCYRVIPALLMNPKTGETEDMFEYAARVSTGWRQPLEDCRVPPAVNKIIEACWSQDSKMRPSMNEVVRQVKAVLEDEAVVGGPAESRGGCGCGCM